MAGLKVRPSRRRYLGPLALLFCVTVLALVYYSAVSVGTKARDRRRDEFFSTSRELIVTEQNELMRCQTYIEAAGEAQSEAPLLAAQAEVAAVRDGLAANKEKTSKLRRILFDCKENVKQLQRTLNGAETSNAESALEALRREEEQLKFNLGELEALDEEARAMTRRNVKTMIMALMASTAARMDPNGDDAQLERHCSDLSHLERYSVVFDIGSTGNRIHVYKFVAEPTEAPKERWAQPPPPAVWDMTLVDEVFVQNRIRMSEQETNATVIAAVDELMQAGILAIPEKARKCTPVEFKATAGLRKKGPEHAVVTLNQLRNHYARVSPLWIRGEAPARILEGREEGPLAWVTVNYLLGNFRRVPAEEAASRHTAAIIDLGGGSTQIVFEPTKAGTPASIPPSDFFVSDALGDSQVAAYQHSYEGLGLNEARTELLMQVQGMCAGPVHWQKPRISTRRPLLDHGDPTLEEDDSSEDIDEAEAAAREQERRDGYGGSLTHPPDLDNMAHFPCFPLGYQDAAGVANGDANASSSTAAGGADFLACVALFRKYVLGRKEGEACPANDCGMWGQPQPPLSAFPGAIYAFSYIHDLVRPFKEDNTTDTLTVAEVGRIGQRRCDALTLASASENAEAAARMGLQPEHECLHLSYVYALLHHGYGIPEDRELTVAKKIKGFETAWTLGAALLTLSELRFSRHLRMYAY